MTKGDLHSALKMAAHLRRRPDRAGSWSEARALRATWLRQALGYRRTLRRIASCRRPPPLRSLLEVLAPMPPAEVIAACVRGYTWSREVRRDLASGGWRPPEFELWDRLDGMLWGIRSVALAELDPADE